MASVKRILFPTKFEELSFVVVHQLLALRKAGLEEIVFLFVLDREDVSYNLFRGLDEELADKLRQEAESRFEDWEKQLADEGVRARHRIELGDPPGMIRRGAEEEGVDFVIAGRQRETLMEKVYLGGTSMALVRRSRIPVLVVKPVKDELGEDDRTRNPFERVILATDFSPNAQRAADFVKGIGAAIDELHLVHVLNSRDLDGWSEADVEAFENEAQAALDRVAADLASVGEVETHLVKGHTAQEILRVRDDQDGTLIVMGTTGKHGIRELWLGSASHRCAELAPVPVLLVPGPSDD